MKRKVLLISLIFVLIVAVFACLSKVNATGMPGARSATNSNGDVFLGGNYLEIGVSKGGSFGTSAEAPASFNSHATERNAYRLGLMIDGDGFDVGEPPTTGDFFLPGTPEERFGVGYKIDGTTYQYMKADRTNEYREEYYGETVEDKMTVTVTDKSNIKKGLLRATVTAVTPENVKVEITYAFGVNDKYYRTEVKVTNNSGKTITDARFFRSFDPDQDLETYGYYDTYNKVICNPDSLLAGSDTNYAMVVARGYKSLEGFFFVSFDSNARASHGVAFSPTDIYMDGLWPEVTEGLPTYSTEESLAMTKEDLNGYVLEDTAIALTFNLGTLSNGQSYELKHYSSLDPDVIDSLKRILNMEAVKVVSRTDTTIEIEVNETYEYSIDDGETWQSTGLFTGLNPSTEYSIMTRLKGETEVLESYATTKNASPDTPEISEKIVTENSITVEDKDNYEYSIDGGKTWQNSPVFAGLPSDTEQEIVARLKETDDTMPGKIVSVNVKTLNESETDLEAIDNVAVTVSINGKATKVIVNKAMLYDAVLGDEDLVEALANNDNIEIRFVIKDSELSEEEKALINEEMGETESIAYTSDVSIELYINDDYVKNITKLLNPISFTLGISKDYVKEGRTFYVIKTHTNDDDEIEVERLKDEDSDIATVTITSDEFSNFTFVYQDADVAEEAVENPSTGDNIIVYISIFVIAVVGLVVFFIINKKSK